MFPTHVPLDGSQRGRTPEAMRVGDVDPASHIEVTVTLRHQERFAIDADVVKRELGRYGLTVEAEYPATGSLVMSATAAQMEAAFHAGLGTYSHRGDGMLRGREGAVRIPAELDGVVSGVFGLDQRRVAHRLAPLAAAPAAAGETTAPLTPADLEARYCFPDGEARGQTIAIAEFGGGYFPDDVASFCSTHGRALPHIETVSVGATPLTPARSRRCQQRLRVPRSGRVTK